MAFQEFLNVPKIYYFEKNVYQILAPESFIYNLPEWPDYTYQTLLPLMATQQGLNPSISIKGKRKCFIYRTTQSINCCFMLHFNIMKKHRCCLPNSSAQVGFFLIILVSKE